MADKRIAKQRFVGLRVKEVSLVGSPANEEEFITVKSTDPAEQPAPTLAPLAENAGLFFQAAETLVVLKGFNKGQARCGRGRFAEPVVKAGADEGTPGMDHSGAKPMSHNGTKTVPMKGKPRDGAPVTKENEMADENKGTATAQPVAKDKAVGDAWMPMCMGKSCDSLSNICRACPCKAGCAELCHQNVPPDEPNTQEYKPYMPDTQPGATDPAMFPTGGQPTTKEEKPVTTQTTAAPAATPPATTPAPEAATEKAMVQCPDCKGKGCDKCNQTGKVPAAKVEKAAEEPAKPAEQTTEKGKPQFSEERVAALRASLESIADIMKQVDPEGFASLMSKLGGETKPLAPVQVASPVSVTKEETTKVMEEAVTKALAPFKDLIDGLNKRVETVEQVRGVSKSLNTETTETPVAKDKGGFWTGVL